MKKIIVTFQWYDQDGDFTDPFTLTFNNDEDFKEYKRNTGNSPEYRLRVINIGYIDDGVEYMKRCLNSDIEYMQQCFNDAINFALKIGNEYPADCVWFLNLWREGEWDKLKKEYPEYKGVLPE